MGNSGFLNLILKRLRLENYFSAWLILWFDMVVSACSSLVSLLLYNLLVSRSFGIGFLAWWIIGSVIASGIMFLSLHTYRAIIRYSTLREIGDLVAAVFGKTVLMGIMLILLSGARDIQQLWLLLFDFLLTFGTLVLLRIGMVTAYNILRRRMNIRHSVQRILIYGIGDKSVSQIVRLQNSKHYKVAGFLTYGKRQKGHILSGYKVYYFETEKELC